MPNLSWPCGREEEENKEGEPKDLQIGDESSLSAGKKTRKKAKVLHKSRLDTKQQTPKDTEGQNRGKASAGRK